MCVAGIEIIRERCTYVYYRKGNTILGNPRTTCWVYISHDMSSSGNRENLDHGKQFLNHQGKEPLVL